MYTIRNGSLTHKNLAPIYMGTDLAVGSFFPGPDVVNISMAYSEVIDDQRPREVLTNTSWMTF